MSTTELRHRTCSRYKHFREMDPREHTTFAECDTVPSAWQLSCRCTGDAWDSWTRAAHRAYTGQGGVLGRLLNCTSQHEELVLSGRNRYDFPESGTQKKLRNKMNIKQLAVCWYPTRAKRKKIKSNWRSTTQSSRRPISRTKLHKNCQNSLLSKFWQTW